MKFQETSQEQHEQIRYALMEANTLTGYAAGLALCLQALCSADIPKSQWGISFTIKNDQVSADIDTPFGKARAVFVIQLTDNGLQGRYIIEKLVASDFGVAVWKPVWVIRVCQDGNAYAGDEGQTAVFLNGIDPSRHNASIVKFALSISHAIASEPGYWR